ncbi:hypothetical protein E8P77_22070 [Soehngenia saccharolytica]|nr:hypothetical protein E8P77_22070 [Soehngenia saccharolytica]
MKGLSLDIRIGKVNTVDRVENNINIFVKREYIDFPGVVDHRMLYIDMIQSTWETLLALYTEKVGIFKLIIKQETPMQTGSRITPYYRRSRVMPMEGRE